MNNSFEFLRTWPLGSSSWRGWGLWNISCPNYVHLKRVLWAALPVSQAWFALALLCCVGSSQRHSPVVLGGICGQLRLIYPEQWSKLGKKSVSCYGKACFSQVRVLFFKALKTVKINISVGWFFSWSHITIQVLLILINIVCNHQTNFCFISAIPFR